VESRPRVRYDNQCVEILCHRRQGQQSFAKIAPEI
jgi:hypothetical protein